MRRAEDLCPSAQTPPQTPTTPHAQPIYPASVWSCESTAQAERMLAGDEAGYVYQRDGHPNADLFTEKCRELHGAEHAMATSSGMAALATALLSQVETGGRIVASRELYGKTLVLLTVEAARMGIECRLTDATDIASVNEALEDGADLLVVETISNPMLRVADLQQLADAAHAGGAKLLVDNTFATPMVCRPLQHGADLVMESVSKMMNGHSDVMLGLLCGGDDVWERVPAAVSAWGFASGPFACWLASRGLATMPLRVGRSCENAAAAAAYLSEHPRVERVDYPGLAHHPDYDLARRQLDSSGVIVTFRLPGDRAIADRFIGAISDRVAFCPSLGETSTTLSHPASTSHRGLTKAEREGLGITEGTIRLSLGVESSEYVLESLERGLGAISG